MAKKSAWVSTAIAAKELGVSDDYLLDLRSSSEVKPGIHIRRITPPEAERHTYRWHLKKMEALMTKWASE